MNNVIKKKLKIVIFMNAILLFSIANGQTVKPLINFFTEEQPTTVGNTVYYKDIDNVFQHFTGTWTHQTGDTTFVVTLWKETKKAITSENGVTLYYRDEIYGHYKLVQNYNTFNAVVLYTSNINYLNSPAITPTVIYGTSIQPNVMAGTIYDINSRDNNFMYYFGKRGVLKMTIGEDFNLNSAHWVITSDEENISDIPSLDFVIPTDITLTKKQF